MKVWWVSARVTKVHATLGSNSSRRFRATPGLSSARGAGGHIPALGGSRASTCQASQQLSSSGGSTGRVLTASLPVLGSFVGAPRVETDRRPSSVCRLCRKQETGVPLALPCPSLIPSLTGPASAQFSQGSCGGGGAPPPWSLQENRVKVGVTLVPSREGGPSGETPHPGRVQTLDSSPPTDAKPRALSCIKPSQTSESCFHRGPSTDRF